MAQADLVIYRGDDKRFVVTVRDQLDNSLIDLSSYSAFTSQVKKSLDATPVIATATYDPGDSDLVNGKLVFDIPAASTRILGDGYVYDVQITDSSGNITTVLYGKVIFLKDVTA